MESIECAQWSVGSFNGPSSGADSRRCFRREQRRREGEEDGRGGLALFQSWPIEDLAALALDLESFFASRRHPIVSTGETRLPILSLANSARPCEARIQ